MNYLFLAVGAFDGVFKGAFSGAGGQIKNILSKFLWGFFILLVVGVIAYFIYKAYKDKTFYIYPCSLTILQENGVEKTRHDLSGGIFWNNGIKDFKVKASKIRKPTILGYIPDFTKSNSMDGRLHFITTGDQTIWQQVEWKWQIREQAKDEDGHIYEYNLIKKPISRETKQIAVNSIKNWRETVDKTKLTAFGIAIGAFIIMVIAHLISLFIQTRLKCGVPA